MNVLPKKFKKQIIDFTYQYEKLCNPHKIRITIPKTEIIATVSWWGEDKCDIDNNFDDRRFDGIYKSKEIIDYNKKIKKFIEKTMKFGKTNFNNKDWIWHRILWTYRPECDEKYNFKNVMWR